MKIAEDDVIPILKELIKIKTENPPGFTIEATKYLVEELEISGISSVVQEYAEGKANLIAGYGEGKKNIILTGHLDTVPSGDESKWKFPPFDGIEDSGKIYGRGATDMKGAVAAFIAVMKYLKENNVKLSKKIVFLGTADEEIGMDGAVVAKESGIMKDCEFVVIGEPTDLQVAIAEKGTLWVKIKVEGKSAHGSTPHLGINAIETAAKIIPLMNAAIPDYEHKILGQSTLNIGKIGGGTLINVVPEYCEFECDYRVVADKLRGAVKEKINEIVNSVNIESKAKVSFEIIHEVPAIELQDHPKFFDILTKKAQKYGKEKLIGVNYGTDGAMLVPDNNTPFVIIGPGNLDQLHVTDEYTEKDKVITFANLILESIIESFSI
ncbi:MAG: M20 family metallopeptidase [Candidatus Heimdallarchaeota archaeon]|nr:M20 family metallopeptidase [Candidatus Heimdallarchaeota archaeon]